MSLATRILWGLVIGIVAALATLGVGQWHAPTLAFMQRVSSAVFDPLGQVFLRMLFFVVIPLVFSSLASGIVQLGQLNRLGPLAGRTFALFVANMVVGVAIGLVLMNLLQPGQHIDPITTQKLMAEYGGSALQSVRTHAEQPSLSLGLLVEMFMPRNLFGAVVGNNRGVIGDVLPLILFAILVGAAGTQLSPDKRQRLQDGLDLITELMTKIVDFALRLAPYAVPAMIYSVIVKVGLDVVLALSVFVVGCLLAMTLHLFGTMSLWIALLARKSPWTFFKQIRPVLVTAFTTSSSNATLPTSLAIAQEELKLRPTTSGFVLPLGATMNMSGTALFEGCVVLFVAQVFGVELSLATQVIMLLLAVLSAVAVSGIPGGSLPMIAGLLVTFGIPPEGIGIIIGVDRILDMARTAVNVGSDIVTAQIVDDSLKRAEARNGRA
ncbi:sodium:dicarboxylate symporter [Rhodanobacter fulvus Jip2]|uniref:Sodium:dicarboxylate symporter n=1 Tax=Rhodanobacter fulvus Jip2 TaxID=1163408 RepID=I4W0W1_9GAMM|nr:dicarboxylate/amino acid:cation symporter [Rhodanobacter fulvus]EIL93102.1 sodium:dicarboxylate symporter [Rhodanobacter fulvus Jip2]